MILQVVAFLSLVVVLWRSRNEPRGVVIRRTTLTRFAFHVFWMLFCWSEWKPEYGLGAVAMAVFSSIFVGLIGALVYGLFGAGSAWLYHAASKRAWH